MSVGNGAKNTVIHFFFFVVVVVCTESVRPSLSTIKKTATFKNLFGPLFSKTLPLRSADDFQVPKYCHEKLLLLKVPQQTYSLSSAPELLSVASLKCRSSFLSILFIFYFYRPSFRRKRKQSY